MPNAAQIRGARGLLGWSQTELAEASDTARRTIVTIEAGEPVHRNSIERVVDTLLGAGIVFIEDEEAPGVSLRVRR